VKARYVDRYTTENEQDHDLLLLEVPPVTLPNTSYQPRNNRESRRKTHSTLKTKAQMERRKESPDLLAVNLQKNPPDFLPLYKRPNVAVAGGDPPDRRWGQPLWRHWEW
jgi:hypothetical protein